MYYAWCNVKGVELNFNSMPRNFQTYIQGEMLPMILVRIHIRDMLGGETGKIKFGK
jgi:hypothetical protein